MENTREKLFVLEQLIKRDFTKKYKRTALGFTWSILSPLLMLLVMNIVFSKVFNRNISHYTTFLFSGYVQFQYFSASTTGAMSAITSNAHIISKINVDKILFVISNGISYLISYICTLIVYILFAYIDGVSITFSKLALLIVPITYQILLTFIVGMIIAVLFVFIRDMKYIYPVLMRITMYGSAIFYSPDMFSENVQNMFYLNPLYLSVYYMRCVMIDGKIPGYIIHLCMLTVIDVLLGLAFLLYKKLKDKMYLYI